LPSDPDDEGQLGLCGHVEVAFLAGGTGLADLAPVQGPVLPVVGLSAFVDQPSGHPAGLTGRQPKQEVLINDRPFRDCQ